MNATTLGSLAAAVGAPLVREPRSDETIDGVTPGVVAEPDSAGTIAATLAWAARERQSVVIRGAGSKHAWGRVPARVDLLVDLRRLNRVRLHAHGDLVATIEAGTALADANAVLAQARQWLPVDPPHGARATIGGLVATNDSGPHRHRYGSPRDLIIGIEIVSGAGRIARAGGQVVKNVAGYDLSRVMSGSFGALAVIVSATFKLAPLPQASCTVRASAADAGRLARLVRLVTGSQLEPVACDLAVGFGPSPGETRGELLLRFAAAASAVQSESAAARDLLGREASVIDLIDGEREAALWSAQAAFGDEAGDSVDSTVLRVNWRPAELEAMLGAISRAHGLGPRVALTGRARVGAGRIVLAGEPATHAALVTRLRKTAQLGQVVVVSGTPALKAAVDVWPPVGDRQILFSALKRSFDPAGILGAGRGPL